MERTNALRSKTRDHQTGKPPNLLDQLRRRWPESTSYWENYGFHETEQHFASFLEKDES